MKKIILSTLFLITTQAPAGEFYQPGLNLRCMGMGGTCASHVTGAASVFVNPANLAKVEGFDFIFLQAQAGTSKETLNFSSQFQGSGTFTTAELDKLYGKRLTLDLNTRSVFAVPNFGFGVYNNGYTNMQFSDPTFPTFDMTFINDYGYAIGAGFNIGKSTSIGATFRHIKRWGSTEQIQMTDLLGSNSSSLTTDFFKNKGVGHAVDLGLSTRLDGALKPVISVVLYDAGVTTFNITEGTKAPPSEKDNLVLGASFQKTAGIVDFVYAFEVKNIKDSGDAAKKLYFGTEANLGLLDLRAGLSQGYLTYGLGIDLWLFQIDASSFGTELGAYAGQLKNERYHVGVTFEFDFDQSFKLHDKKGKRRRLNQRR